MFLRFAILFLILAQSVFAGAPAGYSLQWSDEFNGNSLNTGNWSYTGNGWRNSAYNTSNAVAVSNGCLVITTYTRNGTNFTGFIDSNGKVTNSYGYYEASIQFSNAPGNWSAFWIQGPFVSNTNNNPTNGAEIDVFEHRQTDSGNNNWVNGGDHAIHWDGYASGIEQSASYSSMSLGVGSGFHTYGLLWTSNNYIFSIDGHSTWTNSSFVSSAPEFIRLTSEVESNSWAGTVPGGGYPDLTNSPYQMKVDYVRYYAPTPPQATLYVSPNGSGNSFSIAQPGNLFGVRDYIRTINTNMTGDIVVYLRGGTYQLTNSFQLTNADSGNDGFNIIYENYPGETPVISGGMLVTNWSLVDSGKNIWSAYVGTGINSRQLYVNGLRAIRARGPINPSGFITNSTGFFTTNTDMQNWANQTNIEIVCRNGWKQLRCPVQSINGTNIIMQQPGWTNTFTSPIPGRPWNGNGHRSLVSVSWVENAYELLDSAGMWYLNEATGYLYYIPRPGENLTNGSVVVLPTVEKLIDAEGANYSTPLQNLIFSGITFEYGTWLLPSTSAGYADNQTGILWPGQTGALKTLANVSFQTAQNIQITNCIFEHLGGVGLDFGTGAHDNLVIGNYFDDISSCGITLGEVTDYAATDESQMTDSNSIEDNFIRRCGVDYEDGIGIWVGYSKNTLIAHNDIDNMPYTGISLGWGWGTTNYSTGNVVAENYFGKVMETLSDGGQCYSLSAESNSVNELNYYKDSGYQGIYWDEGSAYWLAISNVFDNVAHNYINFNSSSGTLNNHDNVGTNNFANGSQFNSHGTNDVVTNTVKVVSQFWPAAAQQIILQAGLEPAFAHIKSSEFLVNDTELNLDHAPAGWTYSAARGYGDYHGDVHYTAANDYLQYTFSASAISWIGEMNPDMTNVDVYLDGNFQQTVNCYSATRIAQARLFTATNLSAGPHTIKLVKNSGNYLMLDAFAVTPNKFWLTVTTNNISVAAGNTFSNMVKLDTFDNYSGTTTFSVSGLPSGASASFSSPSVSGAGFSTMTVTVSNTVSTGNYEFDVVGIGGGVTNIATVNLTVIAGPPPLPFPWADADINSPPIAGEAIYTNSAFTVSGCGNDIWSTADQFNFLYQTAIGDETNTARVASLTSSNVWSKSGVMFRETTDANSAYIGLYVTVSNGVSMQFRPSTGASAIDEARATGIVAPYWVRLVRSGNTFTGYRSADGINWTFVAATNLTMANSLLAGLAVCSHDTTKSNLSVFDNVSIAPADTDGDGIPDWWMLQYFGHATGQSSDKSLATQDADGDGFSNLAEFLAGTNPTNSASYLHLISITPTNGNYQINWAAVGGHYYAIQATTNLMKNFSDASPVMFVGRAGESSANFSDTNQNSSARFYRVRLSTNGN
jgi:hypothetical protein